MPVWISDPKTRTFTIMLMSYKLYTVDDKIVIIQDILGQYYELTFDCEKERNSFISILYRGHSAYAYCNYRMILQEDISYWDEQTREIEFYEEFERD